jgi:hypothetical protein
MGLMNSDAQAKAAGEEVEHVAGASLKAAARQTG